MRSLQHQQSPWSGLQYKQNKQPLQREAGDGQPWAELDLLRRDDVVYNTVRHLCQHVSCHLLSIVPGMTGYRTCGGAKLDYAIILCMNMVNARAATAGCAPACEPTRWTAIGHSYIHVFCLVEDA